MVETTSNVHQGVNVRIRRVTRRLTQNDLAEVLGFTPQRLSDVEKMKVIESSLLDKIAKALDTDVEWFKTYDPENDIKAYVDNSTNTISDNQNVIGNNSNVKSETINNYPVEEIIKVTNEALALQDKHYKQQLALVRELAEKEKEIALLKLEIELTNKK